MVIWVGGEGQYLRHDILNLSLYLGLDVSADGEKERGRIGLWVIGSLLSELTISPSTRWKIRGKDFAFGMTLKLLQEEKRNLVAMVFIDEDEIGWDKMRYTGVNDRLMLQTW
ncbi:hypothetical protein Tco_0928647 [Tanacetum coccineum]